MAYLSIICLLIVIVVNITEANKGTVSYHNITDPKEIFFKTDFEYTTKEKAVRQDGSGNYGDLIHSRRQSWDYLIWRELLINEDYFSRDTEFTYRNENPGNVITTVRAINVGQERAFVRSIAASTTNNGITEITGLIRSNDQIRLLIEVYGSRA